MLLHSDERHRLGFRGAAVKSRTARMTNLCVLCGAAARKYGVLVSCWMAAGSTVVQQQSAVRSRECKRQGSVGIERGECGKMIPNRDR